MHENKFSVLILNTVNLNLGEIIILFFFGQLTLLPFILYFSFNFLYQTKYTYLFVTETF